MFFGTVRADGRIAYELPARVRRLHVARVFAETVVEVEVREYHARRSARQNRGFHAMVAPWAKERGWAIEALKQVVLREVFGVREVVHPVTGAVLEVLAEPHTSTLTVGQFSELIERTLELAAEDGVLLEAPDDYTQRRRRAARARPC